MSSAETFTIGGTSFAALAMTEGRKALACRPLSPDAMLLRYHLWGTIGNFIVRGNQGSHIILCRMRYVSTTESACHGYYNADWAAWFNTAVTIAYRSKSYLRCQLQPQGLKIVTDVHATGRGFVCMDAEANFICDGGSS